MFSHALRSSTLFTLLLGSALLPRPALSQQAAGDGTGVTVAQAPTVVAPAPLGPRIAPRLFVTPAAAGPPEVTLPQDRVRAGPNIAMMVAGGAGLVTGLIIGGDNGMILATTGGVVGLVGLYRYLR